LPQRDLLDWFLYNQSNIPDLISHFCLSACLGVWLVQSLVGNKSVDLVANISEDKGSEVCN